jgi:NitT/TauT family transport system substrate-binding protein
MGGVLVAKGKGADTVAGVQRLRQLAAGHVLAQELGHQGREGLSRARRSAIRPPTARASMWPALAKAKRHRPEVRHLGEHRRQRQAVGAQVEDIDVTTSFYNIHHVFQKELGADMGFLAWRDVGLNPTATR